MRRFLIPLAIALLLCAARRAHAQSPSRPEQKLSFEVASVKLDTSGVFKPPSFPLSADDSFTDTGGRFTADFQLSVYIQFAYKLWLIPEQVEAMLSHQPAWLNNEHYLIEAKSLIAHPTKDQMREMMRSLLADRFHFQAHFETHQGPILAMTLAKPGKTGPNLKPHDEGVPCDEPCGAYMLSMQPDKTSALVSRNTTTDLLAHSLPLIGHLGRPVVDRTGLTGRYDFKMNFVMSAPIGPGSGDTPAATDTNGPTFLEAIRDQLGLKLENTEGPIQVLVIDHVERPTEN